MRLNVTAVYTIEQVKEITEAVTEGVPTYISVFAGRIVILVLTHYLDERISRCGA